MSTEPIKPEKIYKPTKKHQQEKWDNAVNLLNEIVKTYVGPSEIHGVGVIAMRDIKKGEKLYTDALFQWLDVPYKYFKPRKGRNSIEPEIAEYLLGRWPQIVNGSHFVYPDARISAFLNHSDEPNYDGKNDVALRDIKKGEEVTEDYRVVENYQKVYKWLD